MYAQGVFYKSPDEANNPNPEYNELWNLTWKILSCVLPKLKNELFSKGTFTPVVQSPTSSSRYGSNENIKEENYSNINKDNSSTEDVSTTQINNTTEK